MNTPLRPVKVFKSHCAPDKIDWNVPEKMTVKEIKKALLTYETNRRKWATAFAWCKKRNMTFKILTEDHLKTF